MSIGSIIENWKHRGEALAVPGANARIWREGQGESVVCLHGVPASGFLYRKVMPERVRSLTVLKTMVNVASFHRPWTMESFAHPAIGWLWLRSMRTPALKMNRYAPQ